MHNSKTVLAGDERIDRNKATATTALLIWLIIRLIQLVFSAGTVFFSHKKLANSVFQPAYNFSRTGPTSFHLGQ
jgi:hypothetical protein